ncbi:MAG: M48 family metallopeptidase [Candidatus Didemnitutus sp.]|nr:M48 family metallopeptidase [Candidatus Didemnitutus sp.]
MSSGEIIHTAAGPCRVHRSDRRTLAISVLPDGSVELSSPLDATHRVLREKVRHRLRWIATQRRKFADLNQARTPLRYVSGATHRYLGRQYRLKIQTGSNPGVRLIEGRFHIIVAERIETAVESSLAAWYRTKAIEQFTRRLAGWKSWCREHRLPEPKLRLLRMPKRWGSSQRDGTIRLNPHLVKAPAACIDYVVAHEICHLSHPYHDRSFFRLLDQLCPNWRTLKHHLESADI